MKLFKKNVLTYGTFDLFHRGHERILKRSKRRAFGGKLYVGVSSDNWNKIKGKESFQNETIRLQKIIDLPYVEEAFLEDHLKAEETWLRDYKKYNIDVIYMGGDHKGKLDYLKDQGIKIKYLPRTKGISSTMLKEQMGILPKK